jgi:predicted ATPase
MLTSFRIKNFKAWKDTGDVRLAPITVFFGVNSAGKTSLLQFLLMLRQTAESSDRRRVLNPGDNYTAVELGTFQDLIFEHDLRRKLEFNLSWSTPKPIKFSDPIYVKDYIGDQVNFSANIVAQDDSQLVESFEYDLQDKGVTSASVRFAREGAKAHDYKLTSNTYDLKRIQGRPWPLPPPTRFYGFPEEVQAYYQNAAFANDLVLALEQQLKRLLYLGPLRDSPKRNYSWAGDAPEHVGNDGNGAIEALLAAAHRKISRGPNKKAYPFQEVIAGWLQKLGLLDSFKAKRIAPNRKEYEVRVRTPNSAKEVDLPDVGFGISQVLPVVVESFYVAPHSTVIIEQPELHLHPRVQAELADLFIEAIHSRENKSDREIQFIVESHSEHFLQRLQRRVAEGGLNPSEVAIYFCEAGQEGSTIQELKVNLLGEIDNWPTNFFGDPMADLFARMEAASKQGTTATQQ